MSLRIAINGYGRIGRNVLRALYENGKRHALDIVAINDLGDTAINAHLTARYSRRSSQKARANPLLFAGQGKWAMLD